MLARGRNSVGDVVCGCVGGGQGWKGEKICGERREVNAVWKE